VTYDTAGINTALFSQLLFIIWY